MYDLIPEKYISRYNRSRSMTIFSSNRSRRICHIDVLRSNSSWPFCITTIIHLYGDPKFRPYIVIPSSNFSHLQFFSYQFFASIISPKIFALRFSPLSFTLPLRTRLEILLHIIFRSNIHVFGVFQFDSNRGFKLFEPSVLIIL